MINKLPAKAGNTLLMNQIAAAVNNIPALLLLSIPISCILIVPLKPISVNAIVGTIANMSKNTQTINDSSIGLAVTLKTLSNNKY